MSQMKRALENINEDIIEGTLQVKHQCGNPQYSYDGSHWFFDPLVAYDIEEKRWREIHEKNAEHAEEIFRRVLDKCDIDPSITEKLISDFKESLE